ncbi:TatD family hydrolase [Elusimicrobiota bacterium]
MYIDTHCHLLDNKFNDDLNDVIKRAEEFNVRKFIEIGCEPDDWNKTLDFVNANPDFYGVIGIHPQEAKLSNIEKLNILKDLLKQEKIKAVGETGLDYYYENSPRETQEKVFIDHLKLAQKINKPVVIHCRDAYNDLINILGEFGRIPGVIHCFSGSVDEGKNLVNMGFLLGIDGPVTYPKASSLRETVEAVPIEKIILETDSPYLPPQEYRGQRNEPCYLPIIAEEIANIKNISIEDVEKITTENAVKLFKLI